MGILIASWMLDVAGTYLAIGLVFSVPFLLRGVERIDPAARGTGWGFRLIVLPGVVAFWPFLAWRWGSGATHPAEERNAHRLTAKKRRG